MTLRLVHKKERVLERALCILVAGTDLVRAGEKKRKICGYFLFLGLFGGRKSSQVLIKQPTCGIKIHWGQMKFLLLKT